MAVYLTIFVKSEIREYIKNVDESSCPIGIMGIMANKAAVAVRFDIYENSVCFINSHLAAGRSEVITRNQNYHS